MFSSKFGRKTKILTFWLCSVLLFYCLYLVVPDVQYGSKIWQQTGGATTVDWEHNSTFDYECRKNGSEPFPHILRNCIRGPRIFFVETSGVSVLNARQACAVESAIRHNPSLGVTVLLTSSLQVNFTNELMVGLSKLPNVVFKVIDIGVFVHGSPIWEWFRLGKWKKSNFKVYHLSDALRLFIIWKYGGIYLDLDIVTLRSLKHLRNSVIMENFDTVGSCILIFDRGHELMRKSIIEFSLHYDPNRFAYNGPSLITRSIREFCNIQNISKVSGAGCDVNILPPDAAFPIGWEKWEKYYEPSTIKNVSTYFGNSYMLHIWNMLSKRKKLWIGHSSLYEQVIREHCPMVYKYAQNVKYI